MKPNAAETVTVQLSEKDVAAWLHFQLCHGERLFRRFAGAALSGAILLCGLSLAAGNRWETLLIFAPIGMGVGVLAGGLQLAKALWSVSEQARSQSRDAQLLKPRTFACVPGGLRIDQEDEELLVPWTYIEALHSTPSHLFFESSNDRALILPRAAFPSGSLSDEYFSRCETLAAAAKAAGASA